MESASFFLDCDSNFVEYKSGKWNSKVLPNPQGTKKIVKAFWDSAVLGKMNKNAEKCCKADKSFNDIFPAHFFWKNFP